jgi:hypothetical protein
MNDEEEQMWHWSGFSPMKSGYLGVPMNIGTRMSEDASSVLPVQKFINNGGYAPNFLSLPALARANVIRLTVGNIPSSPFRHSLSEKPLQVFPST